MKKAVAFLPVGLLALLSGSVTGADIAFEEVAVASGIEEVGRSWGGYWGDFNDDGYPDVWVTNHGRPPSLYLNLGNGTFTNIAQAVISPESWTRYDALDAHGAAWADFDNDGFQDLFEAAAGGSRDDANNLYRNLAGQSLEDVAPTLGVHVPRARPRTPMWLDWNNDGLLDLVINTTGVGAPAVMLMEQGKNGFVDLTASSGITGNTFVEFSILSDLVDGGGLEASISPIDAALRIFSMGKQPMREVTETVGMNAFTSVSDIGAGDFDGDLQFELFMVQGELTNGFDQPDGNTLEARLNPHGSESGLLFEASGSVTFKIYPEWATGIEEIFIGSSGYQPVATEFTLNTSNPNVAGVFEHQPGVSNGLYVGYHPDAGQWTAAYSNAGNIARNLVISSPGGITNVAATGFDPDELPQKNFLLDRQSGVYVDIADLAGVSRPDSGRDIAVGDFDNDTDLDAYVVATGPVTGKPNILYLNNGQGKFTPIANAGGASGTLDGRGDAVSVVDYDGDGWLDLLVTNGKSKAPFERDGPYELFRNLGGDNHWLEIDLEGVNNNRDAIGARIEVTAGGVTQVREQGNGMHFRSQDHRRLHFGLGSADTAERIVVRWPDGRVQSSGLVPADQIIEIVESLPIGVLGEPSIGGGDEGGVFVWQDSIEGSHHFSVRGNGISSEYTLHLIADAPPLKTAGEKLEAIDSLVETQFGFSWTGRVTTGEDRVVIQLSPDTRAMFSLTRDGVSNPRELHLGVAQRSPTPAGWIVPIDSLGDLPAFTAGSDLGLFVGRAASNGPVQMYWSADATEHSVSLELIASHLLTSVAPQQFEPEDSLTVRSNTVATAGSIAGEADGLAVVLPADAALAIAYRQDGLFQRRRTELAAPDLRQPNAYWLPVTKAEERPIAGIDEPD